MWTDPNRRKFEDILQGDVKICDDGKADSRLLPVVPYRPTKRIFKPKDLFEIHLAPATTDADTVVTASSYVRVPVTVKNLRTGDKYPSFITGGQTGGGKHPVSDDSSMVLSATVGQSKRIWYYQIPDGLELVIGHVIAFNSRLLIAPYDDTA